jgi:hypothetical protein
MRVDLQRDIQWKARAFRSDETNGVWLGHIFVKIIVASDEEHKRDMNEKTL